MLKSERKLWSLKPDFWHCLDDWTHKFGQNPSTGARAMVHKMSSAMQMHSLIGTFVVCIKQTQVSQNGP